MFNSNFGIEFQTDDANSAWAFILFYLKSVFRIKYTTKSTNEFRSPEVFVKVEDQRETHTKRNVIFVRSTRKPDVPFPISLSTVTSISPLNDSDTWTPAAISTMIYNAHRSGQRTNAPAPKKEVFHLWRAEFYFEDCGVEVFAGSVSIKAKRGESAESSPMLKAARAIANDCGMNITRFQTTYKGKWGSASINPRDRKVTGKINSHNAEGSTLIGKVYQITFTERHLFAGSIKVRAAGKFEAQNLGEKIAKHLGYTVFISAQYDVRENGEEGRARYYAQKEAHELVKNFS